MIKTNKIIMNQLNLFNQEQAFLMAMQNEHLTSFQILKKVKNIFIILLLYIIREDLKQKGVLKSYLKQDKNYHFAA